MRAAIVSSAALAKNQRMDAGYYLHDLSLDEAVRKAEANLKLAIARLRAARAKRDNAARVDAMITAGEVKLIT